MLQELASDSSNTANLFVSALVGSRPDLLRAFIAQALQLKALDDLYADARQARTGNLAASILSKLGVTLEISGADLETIPADGPVVVVANHPFGLLDAMMLDSILQRRRKDSRLLANSLLCRIPELQHRCFPVDVLGGKTEVNVRTIRVAMTWLRGGGLLGIFPAGEVSHWNPQAGRILDPEWSDAAARIARSAKAPIVPVYFSGSNSLMFQLAGLLHPGLRTAGLARELMNKRDRRFEVRAGSPIFPGELDRDPKAATRYIRARVYFLAHRLPASTTGLRRHPPSQPLSKAPNGLQAEISRLQNPESLVVENDCYAVLRSQGEAIPAVIEEIGRLRERTFRAAGEGTGKPSDIDRFDPYYQHLILWDKRRREIAGSYRFAWTEDVLALHGIPGLYTSTLFRYSPEFFKRIGPAVEVGRSFIVPDRQKEYAPLLLLWQGLARSVAKRPLAPILFGAVSVSGEYCAASNELLVRFLRWRQPSDDLHRLIAARHPFRTRLTHFEEIRLLGEALGGIEQLSNPIRNLESRGVPVLLRQYLKLGGRVIAFNVDASFSNVLDGLVLVDLSKTNRRILDKCMGPDNAARFQPSI
ncbi:MAG: lysophospholipid acyltransferase family protein [Bryobacteraceae bacterium]